MVTRSSGQGIVGMTVFGRRTFGVCALLLALGRLDAASAQQLRVSSSFVDLQAVSVQLSPQVVVVPERSITNSFFIAAAGSVFGAMAGGFLGYSIDRARDVPSEDPGLAGLIIGGLAGSAIGSPALLHVANDGRGSLGWATLLSVAGTTFAAAALWDDGQFLIVVPAVQVGISVAFLH